ncbi:hypothetical protein [Psychrobacter cryohalolentis]|uniref:DUF11 domain-containing protein n=1 Tax=Psychrobacter cryohalolentis (strain ATCC BAA-1226 / DSM 17306 / VKM B-2378 / K5) TaxID=335284 RepID=Q1QBM5_PSYCK|nr:hypothetical protein [Psychrobacter cryohalolentis]ABE74928.1 hypothetical protein Pcryo_1147 [Psychrobacter cryohalolentis K5]ASE25137.1 hypothetical protein CEP87_00570 [Psychrobacter cryohalolentis]
MTARFFVLLTLPTSFSLWAKRGLTLTLMAASFNLQAAPTNMGSMTVTSSNASAGTASGTYVAAGSGATGSFTLVRNENIGYNNSAEITPASGTRTNGIEIRNDSNTSIDRDKFKYTFTITPDDNASIHTIKVGQASYSLGGNSEIARQTLSFTQNSQISTPAQATIRNNPNVPYFYNAMGDYFMGKKLAGNSFSSNNTVTLPQLRFDSSNGGDSGLYYYGITALNGSGNSSSFTPTTNSSGQVSFASGQKRGTLPPMPTFTNILKETSTSPNNQTTYRALNVNDIIANNSSYVSYGIANTDSNYVLAVKNAKTVTLTYEGIMRGNSAIEADVVGETYNEWLSFGVESEPLYYVFSGTVFNDNGGNTNPQINNSGYFNGIFDAVSESGISNSTIKLVDCNNSDIVYASENLPMTGVGQYQLRTPIANLSGKNTVCLIEENSTNTHPIRTTNSKKQVDLVTNKYFYDTNNFGRVAAENAALVLIKYQYVNSCPATIDYPTISNTAADNPNSGFSTKPIDNIEPGNCIAYKITATNRANLSIDNFIMQDMLQKKGEKGAVVDSKLIAPLYKPNDYASDSVAIGNNGLIKTKIFTLAAKSSYDFYFNTKYGTTQSN